MIDPEVVRARRALLDALEALGAHRDAVILVGAQAIYIHTGSAEVALAEFTSDADLAVDPSRLGADPRIEEAMRAAGFTADPDPDAIGTWRSRDWIPVDLLVPDAVAGRGRRSVEAPPHDKRSMRRAVGLEAVLVDNAPVEIGSVEEVDSRTFTVNVAGPGSLLVAKLHKLHERIDAPKRLDAKDAHDVYRLLVAVSTDALAGSLRVLLSDSVSMLATRDSLGYLTELFAAGVEARGSQLAGQAEALVGDPGQVALASSLLAQDLIVALDAMA